MKNLIYIFLIAFAISSCGTTVLVTSSEPATVVTTDSNWCFEKPFIASVNEDSLVEVAEEGFVLGNDKNSIKFYWKSTTTDPFNGVLVAEPSLCIIGTDFCLSGRYEIQIHKNNLSAAFKTGITFGTPLASIFIFYQDGQLKAIPKVCITTARTSKTLR